MTIGKGSDMRLEGWHLIIIIVLAMVLFAAPKLPGMARSLGQSMRIIKSEVRQMKGEDEPNARPGRSAGGGNAVDGNLAGGIHDHPGTSTGVPPWTRA